MENRICKGRLERWNDGKGFGFIRPDGSAEDVFIHISALKKMSRRPVVGDVITYNVHTDHAGKARAVNATIDGVLPVKPRARKRKRDSSSMPILLLLVMVIGAVAYVMDGVKHRLPAAVDEKSISQSSNHATNYSCDGRTHCSQMTSCDEAKFYLKNCPNTEMDGDGDGVPCERQWCNSW